MWCMRIVVLSLMVCALPIPGQTSAPTGRWIRSTPDHHTQAEVQRAVDEAAEGVSWAFRGIARPKLAKNAEPCRSYQFSRDGELFRVHCEGSEIFEWTVGKRSAFIDERGQSLTASLFQEGSTYILTLQNDQGGKRWRYGFRDDGTLKVELEIFSQHLQKPMRWALDYRRQP
jgi:hypothetical protein